MFGKTETEAERANRKFTIYCSFLQIYNEKIFDLLNPTVFHDNSLSSGGLKLRLKNGSFSVDNLYTFECKTKEDAYALFHFGLNNRVIAAHRLNHASSRSHTVLTFTIESINKNNMVLLINNIGWLCNKQITISRFSWFWKIRNFWIWIKVNKGMYWD